MTDDDLLQRSRAFALEVIRFCLRLDLDALGRVAQPALLRAGTGIATHYRAARRARTPEQSAARLAKVITDLDDVEFWLEALLRMKYGPGTIAHQLQIEALELRALVSHGPPASHPPATRLNTDARHPALAP
jgi:four helix bundle protein